MRKTLGLSVFTVLGMLLGVVPAPGAEHASARSCYQIWAQADPDGSNLVRLTDTPGYDAEATIATAKKMGVTIKMVTGDQVAIA